MKVDIAEKYLIHDKHQVLAVYHDFSQVNTMHEYLVVWANEETGSVNTVRVDKDGRAFGQGIILSYLYPRVSYEGYIDGW